MASFRLSWCFTGGLQTFICYFLMSGCWNFFLRFYNFSTGFTVTSFGLSCGFTGWCYCFISHFCMSKRRDFFCFGFLTFCTGVTLFSIFGTGWLTMGFFCFPVVAGCRNHVLEFEDFSTDRTMFSLGFSIFGTGWLYGFINDFGMACCRNFFLIGKDLMAGAAIYYCVSWFFTGCCPGYQFYFCVTSCWNLFLFF